MIQKLTLIFLLFYNTLAAQTFNFSNIGTDRGLPSSEVYYALQDSKGYMWFATNYGVSRYNGKTFTTYTTVQGLTDNCVLTMCEDKKGRIWFGPQNNEICYWQNDTIYTPASGKALSKVLVNGGNYLLGIHVDFNDNVWLSTNAGLYISELLKRNAIIKRIEENNCSVLLKNIEGKKMMVATQKLFYNTMIDTPDFVIGYDIPSKQGRINCRWLSNYTSPIIFRTVLLNNGTVLYAIGNILYIISGDGRVEQKHYSRSIITLNADKDNGLWVGFFKGGLFYYKNQDIHSLPVHCLENYSVSNVCKDHEGGVWVTTLEHGIFYTPTVSIFTYPHISELDDHTTVLGELYNKILVSTLGDNNFEIDSCRFIKKLTLLSKISGKIKKFSALKTIGDTLYIGFNDRVVVADKFLKPIVTYKGIPTKDLIVINNHTVWALTGGGMVQMDQMNLQKPALFYPASFRLTCALVEKDSSLYVGSKSGLYLFKHGKYARLDSIDPVLKSQIMHIRKDEKGTIWLATVGEGVLVFRNSKVIKRIKRKDGLVSDICSKIEIDKYGNVWVGTPNGLSCIIKGTALESSYLIKNITNRNGLNNNEVTTLYAKDNTLWVGTVSGISSVDIINATLTLPTSPIYLNTVQVNNISVSKTDSLFTYDQNNIRLVLEGLTYSDDSRRRYRYRLNGFDTAWNETHSAMVEFNNLPANTYTFFAEVANVDGTWSKDPVIYNFSIKQPFWTRWWFILLEITAVGFAIHLFIRYRTSAITKREEEKTRINKLLSDYQMKALRAQMNPHFIFNAINSIQNFILLKDRSQAFEYLAKFSRLIRLILINTKENEVTLKQEIEILSLYVELEQLRFENAFEYSFQIDETIDTELVVVPGLLIQPYVENAIWHGLMPLKERKGILTISIQMQIDILKISIKDNGVGRARSSQIQKKITHQSMGMDLNSKRVELFAEGTATAQINVKDSHDDNGDPSGTYVEIVLPMVESF